MIPLLLASLLLGPVLADEGEIRLAADSPGVAWTVDGVPVAAEGRSVVVVLGPGPHLVWAHGPDHEPWTALARPAPIESGALLHADAWVVSHAPPEVGPARDQGSRASGAWLAGAAAPAAAAAWTKRP